MNAEGSRGQLVEGKATHRWIRFDISMTLTLEDRVLEQKDYKRPEGLSISLGISEERGVW
jgi:hypothetical protein